jgi:hypothetical protein
VLEDNAKLQALLTSYDIEFFEIATPEKLLERGVV